MRQSILLPALAGLAFAAPRPQGIDFSAIDSAPVAALVGPPATVASQNPTTIYNALAAASSVAAAVSTAPVASIVATTKRRRQIDVNAACAPQPDGYGPAVRNPDTDSAFLAYQPFATTAKSAAAPFPYSTSFQNLQGSSQMNTYMGLYTLKSYDVAQCTAYCDAAAGCLGVNIYFERDPTINPAAACPNPASFTNIKCTLWGSAVTAASATNMGQWRGPNDANGQAFHVVIAGSNGYSKPQPPPSQTGYTGPTALPGAIDVTTMTVNGKQKNVYIGAKYFNQPYDASVCASLCSATTADNKATAQKKYMPGSPSGEHDGTYQACNFYDAYLLSSNGVPQGLYCALYTDPIPASYATMTQVKNNKGDTYTVSNSYSYSLTAQDRGTVATS
ncbi:hypothetical protein LTR50_005847 [Elasticomyces elasticus]|nr:hypothetical protein LTR50_005847 [Elasticomyces elasticus]